MKKIYETVLENEKYCFGCRYLKTKWLGLGAFCFFYFDDDNEPKHIGSTGEECDLKTVKRPKWCLDG